MQNWEGFMDCMCRRKHVEKCPLAVATSTDWCFTWQILKHLSLAEQAEQQTFQRHFHAELKVWKHRSTAVKPLAFFFSCLLCVFSTWFFFFLFCPCLCQYICFVVHPSFIWAFCGFGMHTENPSLPSNSEGLRAEKNSKGPQRGEETDEWWKKNLKFLTITAILQKINMDSRPFCRWCLFSEPLCGTDFKSIDILTYLTTDWFS